VPGAPVTATAGLARLANRHRDLYKPGTRHERMYMQGISSIYQSDSIVDSTIAAAAAIEESVTAVEVETPREVISGVKVYTQDAEFELDDE
jgi:hypothetical protein